MKDVPSSIDVKEDSLGRVYLSSKSFGLPERRPDNEGWIISDNDKVIGKYKLIKEKKMVLHKIRIEKKYAGENLTLTGANTMVYLDDKKLEGVRSFKFEIGPRDVGKVTIEFYPQEVEFVDVLAETEIVTEEDEEWLKKETMIMEDLEVPNSFETIDLGTELKKWPERK